MSGIHITENHVYYIDGVIIPSVTQIITEAGLTNFSKCSEEVLERARDFGSNVHLACKYWDEQKLNEKTLDGNIRPYLDGWIKFTKEIKPMWSNTETPLYSKKYGFAGTPDRIGILNKCKVIVDIKTSSVVSASTAIQLAGYEILSSATLIKRYSVKLEPDKYTLREYTDRIDTNVFLSCLQLYRWKEKNNLVDKFYESTETI